MKYIWQQKKWTEFRYNLDSIHELTLSFAEKAGRVDGLIATLPEPIQTDTIVDLMVSEAMKSSEIEGEMISRQDVMSSIKNNLGLNPHPKQIGDKRAVGISELMVCMRNEYSMPISRKMLFEWHTKLMKGAIIIRSGAWRTHTEPMLIVSGTLGDERVHYEAPPSKNVPAEMKQFIKWFNETHPRGNKEIKFAPVRAAIAHLYFESIHPFEDGNGRIGRALAEKALSQGIGRPVLLSLSESIRLDREGYYNALKNAQRSNDITDWILWFSKMLVNAQTQAEAKIEFTLKKTKLFDRVGKLLNPRQLKVLNRMLCKGFDGYQDGMSAKKYMAIAKTTKATATRDLQSLVKNGIFISTGGGRSTRYQINLDKLNKRGVANHGNRKN